MEDSLERRQPESLLETLISLLFQSYINTTVVAIPCFVFMSKTRCGLNFVKCGLKGNMYYKVSLDINKPLIPFKP